MTSVHALCWLPSALCAELSAALQGSLAQWTSAWGLPSAGQVHARLLDADGAVPAAFVDLLAPPAVDWLDALARALFKLGAGESDIVDAVIHRMTNQLEQQLQRRFPHGPPSEPRSGMPGHRGMQLTVELLGRRCGVELGVSQLRAGGWLKSASLAPLQRVNFEQAAKELPVPFVAELGRATLSVSDLMQLTPGDVLLLEESLDAPLRMTSPGCAIALTAHLGATANPQRRAARWLAS